MIETKRLILRPMDSDELKLNVYDPESLDKKWNLNPDIKREPEKDKHVRAANENRAEMVLKYPENYEWYTNWALILKDDSAVIGGIMVMAESGEDGEVEFGYGTDPAYQNKGYMTEAVAALKEWAFKNPDLRYVIAETYKDNDASQKVLIKNGFEKYKETEEGFWWRVGK